MEIASNKIYSVQYRGAQNTRKPSTITMSIESSFALKAAALFEKIKKNESSETGLIKVELIAFYEGDEEMEAKLRELNLQLNKAIND